MTGERLRQFEKILAELVHQLTHISKAHSEEPLAPGKWSRKGILGHLIDSASNNHPRFA
jgi:hypothetical protein